MNQELKPVSQNQTDFTMMAEASEKNDCKSLKVALVMKASKENALVMLLDNQTTEFCLVD
jgi:hypothetical protein